jgi:hypothetical protein
VIPALATSALSFAELNRRITPAIGRVIYLSFTQLYVALTFIVARLANLALSCKKLVLWSRLFLCRRLFLDVLAMLSFSFSSINKIPILALGTRFDIIPTYTIAEPAMSNRKTPGIGMNSSSGTNTTLHPSNIICHSASASAN